MKENYQIQWPNFFVVGAARAGTDSLYNYLYNIPGIFMPSIKSIGYFSSSDPNKFLNKKRYLEFFKDVKNETAIGEVNPDYLFDAKASKLIHDVIPNAKIIISLRNPSHAAYSLYLHKHKHGQIKLPFHSALTNYSNSSEQNRITHEIHKIIQTAFYSEPVKRYFEEFGNDKVKIIIFEEFIKNTENTIREILKFLDVDNKIPLPSNLKTAYNQNVKPLGVMGNKLLKNPLLKKTSKSILPGSTSLKFLRLLSNKRGKPQLLSNEYDNLQSIYYSDIKKLENILGRKLPW